MIYLSKSVTQPHVALDADRTWIVPRATHGKEKVIKLLPLCIYSNASHQLVREHEAERRY